MSTLAWITPGALLGSLLAGCASSSTRRDHDRYLHLVSTKGAEASWFEPGEGDRVRLSSGRVLSLVRRDPKDWGGIDGLVLEGVDGIPEWRVSHDPDPLARRSSWIPGDCITVIERGERIVLVSWSSVATGAYITLLDARDGGVLWQRPALALGDVVHSRYTNRVTAAATDDAVVLWGRESGGHYLEAIGFDGQVRYHRRLK